jgi:hypothetical protein
MLKTLWTRTYTASAFGGESPKLDEGSSRWSQEQGCIDVRMSFATTSPKSRATDSS